MSLSPALNPSQFLTGLFNAAVESARPEHTLPAFLPSAGKGRTLILGAGKAAAVMARAAEQALDGPVSGCVVTRYGHAVDCRHITVLQAAHPVPDAAGRQAAQRILDLARQAGPDDTVILLISGGGSALLPLPLPGITLADKQALGRELLRCGATIGEINIVRRHLSAIKGGRLAAACHPARVINLLISDVPGDDPTDIASGPGVGDPSTSAQALDILRRYRITPPASVQAVLKGPDAETVKPDDTRLAQVSVHTIASSQQALMAAVRHAEDAGITPLVLSDRIEGESRDVASVMAAIALQVRHHGQPLRAPCVLLSGGETTVTVRGNGRGGRNVEFALALAVALQGEAGIHAIAGDTDGVDGQEEIAGAMVHPDTLQRAMAAGLDPRGALDANDAHSFFEQLGDNVITGPTLTNVNDFRAILIL